MGGALQEFGKLDAGVQGAIIAGLIALIGTFLTVVAAVFSTFYQLRRDRIERKTDRALELKKEELLCALEGVATSQSAIGDLSNPDVPDALLNERVQAGQARTKRAQAVAEIATIRAGAEWGKEFTRQYFKLLPLRLELLHLKVDADVAQSNVNSVLFDQTKLNEMQRSAILADDTPLFDRVNRSFEFVCARFDPAFAKQQQAMSALQNFRTSMALECVRAQIALRPRYNKVVEAIRREIGVDGDMSEYAAASEADDQELFDMLNKLVADAEAVMERTMEKSAPAIAEPTELVKT